MWRTVYYPEGGFGRKWQARPASSEKTSYEVDIASGDVRRRRSNGSYRSLNQRTNEEGYKTVGLRVSKREYILVHNLVCWVVRGPRPVGKTSVDHGDRNRANNNFTNLTWASPRDQACNRSDGGGRKRLLPFEPEEGEVVYDFRGSPGVEYTGPQLQFTSHGRIVRQGRISQVQRIQGQYPKLSVSRIGKKARTIKVHILVWSAVYGPNAQIPTVIHHRDNEPSNFRPSNLQASNYSHNAVAAHDAGRFDHARSKRQCIRVVDADSGESVGEYASQMEAARFLRANQGSISQCLSSETSKSFKGVVGGINKRLVVSRV
jgi:hypothetical protein